MAWVGGVGDVGRYRAERLRFRGHGAEHSSHSAVTAITHNHHRKHATLCMAVRGLWH
jgi:hypothetical protein